MAFESQSWVILEKIFPKHHQLPPTNLFLEIEVTSCCRIEGKADVVILEMGKYCSCTLVTGAWVMCWRLGDI